MSKFCVPKKETRVSTVDSLVVLESADSSISQKFYTIFSLDERIFFTLAFSGRPTLGWFKKCTLIDSGENFSDFSSICFMLD